MFSILKTGLLCISASLLLSACGGGSGSKIDAGSTSVDNLKLSQLNVSLGSLDPVFSPGQVGVYQLEVDKTVSSIDFTATPEADGVVIESYRRVAPTSDKNDPSYDGRVDETSVTAGKAFARSLEYGDNVIVVRVSNKKKTQSQEYIVKVHRANPTASLNGVLFNIQGVTTSTGATTLTSWFGITGNNFSGKDTDILSLGAPATFDPTVLDYNFSVGYSVCAVGVAGFTNDRDTNISINGSQTSFGALRFNELNVGDNVVDILTTSGDGADSKTYSLHVTRSDGTQDEKDKDAHLRSITISSGDWTSSYGNAFHCFEQNQGIRVDNRDTSIDISALPMVDGAAMKIGPLVEVTTSSVTTYVFDTPNVVDLNPGEAYTANLPNVGINRYGISVRPTADSTPISYELDIVRTATNRVSVSNGSELQAALKNAQPGDEIVMSAGTFTAPATAAESGKDGVHFYSANSGTADQPIYLRAIGDATLSGDDIDSDTVLELSGDYWRVGNIDGLVDSSYYGPDWWPGSFSISSGQNGLVLDNSSHDIVDGLSISNIGERGIQLRNGSSDNVVQRISVHDTGKSVQSTGEFRGEALVIGSSDSEWSTAPTPGPYNPLNDNNVIGNFKLGPNVAGELVDVKEGSSNNLLQFGVLDSEGTQSPEDNAQIVLRGNNNEVRYNSFYGTQGTVLAQGAFVADASGTWHTESWGEDNFIHGGIYDFGDVASVLAVSADSSIDNLDVQNNQRADGAALAYSGAAINELSASQLYTIQTLDDTPLCLQKRQVQINTAPSNKPQQLVDFETVFIGDCDASDPNQQFRLVNQGGPSGVNEYLIYLGTTMERLTPLVTSSSQYLIFLDEANTNVSLDSYFFRWYVDQIGTGQFEFRNKFSSGSSISAGGVTDAFSTGMDVAVLSSNSYAKSQRFNLVPVP